MDGWISVKDHLPDDGQTVRIWADGEHIATFRKGISEEDRRRMKSHEIDDPIVWVWSESTGINAIPRSDQYYSKDVFGNNLVPYNWEGDGCMIWKGQDVTHWAQKSAPPAEEGHDMKCTGVNCPMQYPYDVSKCTAVESCKLRTLTKTNADRIRSMTDEELAGFLLVISTRHSTECISSTGIEFVLHWLLQPAEEEDNGNQRDI